MRVVGAVCMRSLTIIIFLNLNKDNNIWAFMDLEVVFIWAMSWENLFCAYANNKGADQPAQSDQHLCCLLPHHHHHHIHFRALFSFTESWAFWQVFLEGVLSTQNDSEGQQNPYLASFCHSQALHPMISLACQIFSVQPHSACILLQSSLCCALHVQTISSYWCGAPHLSPGCQALWEGSLS